MPIKPENRRRYPSYWKWLSHGIRFGRAKGQCECRGECRRHKGRCDEIHMTPARHANGRIILTVAHLDHQPENNDPRNLRAMCQRCHLTYDAPHRAKGRRVPPHRDSGE